MWNVESLRLIKKEKLITMKEIFEEYDIEINENQLNKFEVYYSLLKEYNGKFNITAIEEKKEVYLKHFVDSILYLKEKELKGSIIDVGSGGGFPIIPLKIMCEDLSVTALEANSKKCDFLRTIAKELNLKNVEILCGRAEEFSKKEEYREKFDYCSARAVARLNVLAEYCMPFVKVKGEFLAYKGEKAEEELKEAEKAIKILGGELKGENKFILDGAKRSIIEIVKLKHTDKKYPRANGRIRKSPL